MCEEISLKSTLKRTGTHCMHEILAYLGELLTYATEKNPSPTGGGGEGRGGGGGDLRAIAISAHARFSREHLSHTLSALHRCPWTRHAREHTPRHLRIGDILAYMQKNRRVQLAPLLSFATWPLLVTEAKEKYKLVSPMAGYCHRRAVN